MGSSFSQATKKEPQHRLSKNKVIRLQHFLLDKDCEDYLNNPIYNDYLENPLKKKDMPDYAVLLYIAVFVILSYVLYYKYFYVL